MVDHSPRQCRICGEYHCLAGCVPIKECIAKINLISPESASVVIYGTQSLLFLHNGKLYIQEAFRKAREMLATNLALRIIVSLAER